MTRASLARSRPWSALLVVALGVACGADPAAPLDAAAPVVDAGDGGAIAADAADSGAPGDAGASATDTGAAPADGGTSPEADAGAGPEADAGAGPVEEPVDPTRPQQLLFIGNSFTLGGPIPTLVDLLANDAGWPDPEVEMSAFGGETLQGHRGRAETVALVDRGGWDVVVLQEFSTRPTDALGDPARFKEDATWFHDRVRARSPRARVVLYETWARHPDHAYYPSTFRDPAEMQAQLRAHYEDATFRWIPARAAPSALMPPPPLPELARAGDAWERHLAGPSPLRLHAADDYHAAEAGQYLNALVLYSTIYRRAVAGRTPWRLGATQAQALQSDADAVTGWTMPGGPPRPMLPLGLTTGQVVQLDLGDTPSATPGWNDLDDPTGGSRLDLRTADGAASTVDVYVTVDFGGVNGVGLANNTLGYPGAASRDSFFAGSFATHAEGLMRPGQLTLRGLDPAGAYTLTLFASRAGDDGGMGRLTRYQVTGAVHHGWQDLDAADNTSRVVTFAQVSPSSAGELIVDVEVSPDGAARFAYLGVLTLRRL